MVVYNGELKELGFREMDMLGKMLVKFSEYVPDGFSFNELYWGFNTESGYVFLYNEDYDTLIMEGDELVRVYYFEGLNDEMTLSDVEDYIDNNGLDYLSREDCNLLVDKGNENLQYKVLELLVEQDEE